MSINVWPFLISRNRYLDYRTVVAPDFICEAKIYNLLARAAEGELTKEGQGFIRYVIGSKAGDFTIAFRVIKATEQDIDFSKGSNILKDQFGREIEIIEGIVAKGIINNLAIPEQIFEDIHKQLTGKYQEFWSLLEAAPAVPSEGFSFSPNMESITTPIRFKKLADLDLTPKPVELAPKKSTQTPVKLLLILISIFILMTLLGFIFGNNLFAKKILLGCANTLEEKIEFKTGDNKISEQLEQRKKKYSENVSIYLSGSLKIESPKNLVNKEFPRKSEKQSTIKLSPGNILELNYHPIDLAIADIKNQRVNDDSKITLRMIDRSGCT